MFTETLRTKGIAMGMDVAHTHLSPMLSPLPIFNWHLTPKLKRNHKIANDDASI